jgi:hypothetical protein
MSRAERIWSLRNGVYNYRIESYINHGAFDRELHKYVDKVDLQQTPSAVTKV